MAAERALGALPVRELGDRIGVVVGHEGKTRRGARANERLFGDRVARVLRARGVSPAVVSEVVEALRAGSPATGPYTQPGNMPNVISGRVANVFGLRGPNFVVDTSEASLLDALAMAELVLDEDCEVVLAGAVNAFSDEVARGASATVDLGRWARPRCWSRCAPRPPRRATPGLCSRAFTSPARAATTGLESRARSARRGPGCAGPTGRWSSAPRSGTRARTAPRG